MWALTCKSRWCSVGGAENVVMKKSLQKMTEAYQTRYEVWATRRQGWRCREAQTLFASALQPGGCVAVHEEIGVENKHRESPPGLKVLMEP